jgi:hypothetical protein
VTGIHEPGVDRADDTAAGEPRRHVGGAKHAVRSLVLALVTLAGLAIAAVMFAPLLVLVPVPTTFGCRAFIDTSAEANLAYPKGRVLSYRSHEGVRQLIEMSSPQLPGFTKDFAISADDRDAFRWFDQRLRAMGWRPLNPEAELQVSQSSGDTARGGTEVISLVRFDADRIPPGPGVPPEGQALLRYTYLIQDPAGIPACR